MSLLQMTIQPRKSMCDHVHANKLYIQAWSVAGLGRKMPWNMYNSGTEEITIITGRGGRKHPISGK